MTLARSPAGRRSAWLLPAVVLAYAGGVVAYLPLLTLLLPIKAGVVAGAARMGTLTASVIAGAIAASVANIAFGALSDRSAAAGGGRRRWLAFGVAATAVSYAGVGLADTPEALVVAVAGFQLAVNALLAPLLAIMADEVPDARKGLAGGLLALGGPVASGVGVLLIEAVPGAGAQLALVPLIGACCVAPLLLVSAPAQSPAPVAADEPADARALAIAWAARLLVQAAGAVLSTYLLYYFDSIAPAAAPGTQASRVARVLLVASLLPLPVAVAAGRLSDRSGRRRPILCAAAGVAALGLVGMAAARSWPAGALAFALYSVGSAVFLALHAGFAMRLLPDPRWRGRDLGLLNLTNTLPLLIGPLLAWALATPQDFAALLLVLAALTAAGGALMLGATPRRQRLARHQRT